MIVGSALIIAGCESAPLTESSGPLQSMAGLTAEKVVLVGFMSPPGAAEIAFVEGLGGAGIHRYKYVPVLAVTIPTDREVALAAAPGVAYVEDDLELEPLAGKQVTDYGVSQIEAPAAWIKGYRGQGVRVGIFDSGIDIDHPDLEVAGGIDLVGDGNGLDDCQGHGTHVAGIVAARDNGNHSVGVAPSVELYSMRFADCDWAGATLVKMIQGIEWAIERHGCRQHVVRFRAGGARLVPALSQRGGGGRIRPGLRARCRPRGRVGQ